jgi:hypothetical protein
MCSQRTIDDYIFEENGKFYFVDETWRYSVDENGEDEAFDTFEDCKAALINYIQFLEGNL